VEEGVFMLFLLLWGLFFNIASSRAAQPVLDCGQHHCEEVLPAAVRFEQVEGKPYQVGFDSAGQRLGWVALSSDLVDVKGYSSKPLHTLVGLDEEGVITGSQIVHHSEPILLVGIPQKRLTDFVGAHTGLKADQKVSTGSSSDGAVHIDGISGATVTVLSESRTILETARVIAEDVGVIKGATRVPGHLVHGLPIESWGELEEYLGHLVVNQDEIDERQVLTHRPYLDLWFGIVDSPQVGVPLLGEKRWKWSTDNLADDEHLLVIFNRGTSSFKGSGFVRGGIFDRFRLEQGLRTMTFRDMDYQSLPTPRVEGAPTFSEGGSFVIRDDQMDPGQAYEFVFLASSYATKRGAFQRDFFTFRTTQRLSRDLYVLDGPDPEDAVWRQAWSLGWWRALIVAGFYLVVCGFFVARRWMAKSIEHLRFLNRSTVVASFFILGMALHAQPSITQILTLSASVKTGWDWRLYLSEPSIFVSWIGIAVVTIVWGRGTFCGWLCPYGSLAELCYQVGQKVGIPTFELPDSLHSIFRNTRYLVLGGLLAAFLYQAELGEVLAEIEPFKSTFFVALWTRHSAAIVWWGVLFLWSFTTYRPFCRYLCPLGAALAIPSTVRLSGPYRREFCTRCKICTRGCSSKAFRADGSINPRECMNCWECESNWQSDQVCPPLVSARRKSETLNMRRSA
jgi:NosR/NirI family nitrous oxide reductase transcriptional regulator